MLVTLVLFLMVIPWAVTIAASVRLRRLREAAGGASGWAEAPTAKAWTRAGNLALIAPVPAIVVLGITDSMAALVPFAMYVGLSAVFVVCAREANGSDGGGDGGE